MKIVMSTRQLAKMGSGLDQWLNDHKSSPDPIFYENTPKKDIQAVFQTQLPAVEPQQVFKETYDFKFIELRPDPDEKELQDKILANLITFLKELGEDFCIRGSQVPIKIDRKTHHIDLVLYHCGIPCNVLVDLKIGKLGNGDIGQMNKYIGYWRRHKQYEHEQPTIGLIICDEDLLHFQYWAYSFHRYTTR